MTYNYRQDETLETIARNVIAKYDQSLLKKPCAIPIEDIIEQTYGLQLEFLCIRKNGRILGETIFEDTSVAIYEHEGNVGYTFITVKAGTIIIDESLLHKRSYGRFRFTCAHELAHWVIDRQYFQQLGESAAAMTIDSAKDMARKTMKSSDTNALIERQANRMASRLLMPKCTLKPAFHQASHDHSITEKVAHFADIYDVSKQAMKIRLEELGLLRKS